MRLNDLILFTSQGLLESQMIKSRLTPVHSINEGIIFPRLSFPDEVKYMEITDSLDDFDSLVQEQSNILVASNTGEIVNKSILDLEVGDWVYHPWINVESKEYQTTIDLSEYNDNLKTRDQIFVFTHDLLEDAKKLEISFHALKNILIFESADYEEYIPKVKEYMINKYGSFDNIGKIAKEQFTFPMPRYLHTNHKDYIYFIVAIYFYSDSKLKLFNSQEDLVSFKTEFKFNKQEADKFVKPITRILKYLNVKFSTEIEDTCTIITVNNKPLHNLIAKGLNYSLYNLKNAPIELQNLFLSLLPPISKKSCSLRLLLQFKEFFYLHKRILSITTDDTGTLYMSEKTDDFKCLDSDLIVIESGYFTRVINLNFKIMTRQFLNVQKNQNYLSTLGVIS